jgi:hypothetical protein
MGVGVRDRALMGKLLLVVTCTAIVAGSATRETAQASHCIITPALAKAAIGQGLPYARLVRGKETLVKGYLTLPATLPKCAGTTPAIKIMGATLTLKNGGTQLGPVVATLPDAVAALITSKSTAKNQPADPKFVLPGSQLPPSGSNIGGSFTASFEITVQYQSSGAAVKGVADAFSSTQSVTFTSVSGNPISRAVEGPTKALRILAVPMGISLDSAATSTLEAGLTALSGMYPVQDQTGSGQPRVGVLPTTQGGIRYALNNPGMVDIGDVATTPFCGTSSNYASIQAQLQGFHNAFNDLNDTENDVDRTIGVVPSSVSTGSATNPSCFEGFTVTNTKEAWVRVVPDAPGAPSTTASLLGMELCHTFGCTTSSGTFHSLYTNADNLPENVDLGFNPLTWSWLSDDRSAMRFTGTGWNNSSTIFEKGDFGYLLCGLGGANTSGCPALGAGTLTGVPAADVEVFLLDGTTDDTRAGTRIRNSFVSAVQPETAPAPASDYHFLQKDATVDGDVVSDLRVPVEFVHSGHGGTDDVGPGTTGAFSFAFPFHSDAVRVELVKQTGAGTTVLYAANKTATPVIDSVQVEPSILGAPEPSVSSLDASTDSLGATSEGPGTSGSEGVVTTSAVEATSLSDTYVFNGKGGYSADGLGQDGTGGTIQADVPAGSTVQKAFLYGTYFGTLDPDVAQRTINFDGTTVETTKIGDTGSSPSQLSTTRADVTTQVATKVGSGGAVTNFAVNSDPSSLDGVGLVVVYSNSTRPETTIAVLDGTASQAGDTTTFTYTSALDKTAPNFSATMSLGVGFGFQGGPAEPVAGTSECGTGSAQSSLVDVNGTRLTSCAGNYDDGYGENGGLITVGGVGDSTANPSDPLQQPADGGTPRVTDDERYDIAPFTSQGDTQLTITTSNPSTDDNLFLAVVQIAAEAAVGAPSSGTDVEVEVTDDNPRDARATCYVDWDGVLYPFDVSIPPTSFDEVNDKAIFECSLDPDTIGATDAGNVRITAVAHDTFTQSNKLTTTLSSTQTPPVASIAAPTGGDTFLQFETIVLRGSALDLEQGHLTGSELVWTENVPAGPLSGGEDGEEVFLTPPSAGWAPGTYTVTLTATDITSKTSTDTVTFEILRDADHDGIPANVESQSCFTSGDNDPTNARLDYDGDGIPNDDDQYTTNGPCVREYNAIINFDPDDLQRSSSGPPITVTVTSVPGRSVSEIVSASVKISKVVYVDAGGHVTEANPNQTRTEWKMPDATAKFDRQTFIAFLNSLGIANQRITVEVSGIFTDSKPWVGRDFTNVK